MQYLKDGVKTFSLLILSTIIAYIYFHFTHNTTNISTVYMLYVFLVARLTSGYVWCVIASICGMLGVNYMFTYPYFAFNFSLSGYPFAFIGMLIIAIITSTLTAHAKEQSRIKALREACLNQLNEINKQLIIADSSTQIIELTLNYVVSSAHISCVFYTEDPIHDQMPVSHLVLPEDEAVFCSAYERAIAHLAYVSEKPSGMSYGITSTSPDSKCFYLPVISHSHTWGVLGFLANDNPAFIKDNLSFFTLMIPQMALAFERQNLLDDHQRLAIEAEKEKMRGNLLRAISHDLRTPLTSIIGSSAAYLESTSYLKEDEKLQLITQIHEDSNWLLHMVENLLSVTRIVKETAKVIKSSELLEEVIAESVSRIKKRYPNAAICVTVPDEMVLVPMDATLIEQVIMNLIENALKYAKASSPIQVKATVQSRMVQVDVIDDGIGIAKNTLETLFDGYCPNHATSIDINKGIGIGLSICQTIISAHSGTLTARNLEKGAIFTFTLPLEEDILEGVESNA